MTKRTVVIRRQSRGLQLKTKRKSIGEAKIPAAKSNAGFARPVFVVLACAVFVALLYIYSINHSAVKGYEIRSVEKEISELKKENENLRIKEAQLKSLYRVEQSARDLNMSNVSDAVYLEENPSVAYSK